MQQTNSIALRIIGAKGIGTYELGQKIGLMRRGWLNGPHFMQNDGHTSFRQLP
jgi:hypothetical protein